MSGAEADAPLPPSDAVQPLTDKLRQLTEHVLRLGANEMQLDVSKRQGAVPDAPAPTSPSADTVLSIGSTVLFADTRADGDGEYEHDQEGLKHSAVLHGELLRESLTATACQINALSALHEAEGDMDERGRLVPAVRRDHTGALVDNAAPAPLSRHTLHKMAQLYGASKSSLNTGVELQQERMWRDTALHYHRGLMELDKLQTLLDDLAPVLSMVRRDGGASPPPDVRNERGHSDDAMTSGGSCTTAQSQHRAAGKADGDAPANQRKQWQSGSGGGDGKAVRSDGGPRAKAAGGERAGSGKAAKKRSKRCTIL